MESRKIRFFNKLSLSVLLGSFFFSLFFFIPYNSIMLETSKGFILSIGVALSLFFWLIARLGEGKFNIPKDRLILFAVFIPISFLLASLFSLSSQASFFGTVFETGTFGFILIMFLLFFLATVYFQTEKRLWYFLGSILFGAFILSLFELINIFIGFEKFLPGLLKGIPSGNLVGNWNNFALFFGLIVLLATYSIEFLKTSKLFLILEYFLLISGMFFLIILNVSMAWILVGIFSIIIFIYSISVQHAGINIIHQGGEKKRFPFEALIVVFICFSFIIGRNFLGSFVSRYVDVPNTDVRPSITTTAQVAFSALKHNPLLGTGPNTFAYDWARWQPKKVIQTDYWNVSFQNGFSFLSTLPATVGILGFGSFLLFLTVFFIRGFQSLKIALKNSLSNYFIFTTLMISVYSWIVVVFYNPGIVLTSLSFISSGVLIGILVFKEAIPVKQITFSENPKRSLLAILVLMILMIGTLSISFIFVEKLTALVYFSKSVNGGTDIDSLARSEKMLLNALVLNKNDVFYRNLSQVYIGEIGVLLNNKDISPEVLKLNLQQLVNYAENAAEMAIAQNPGIYLNYLNLGNVYSTLTPLSIEGSYENAIWAYNKAQELAPNNPSILLSRAQLELANKNKEGAKKFINQALDVKKNYVDAIFFLAQIENEEGNVQGAIKQVEYAGKIRPNDPEIFFRLGLLRYNSADYGNAIGAFEQAVILNPNYLDARYLLGQSYQKVGRNGDALVQFNILNKIIPNNQGLKDAIDSLSGSVGTEDNTKSDNSEKNEEGN